MSEPEEFHDDQGRSLGSIKRPEKRPGEPAGLEDGVSKDAQARAAASRLEALGAGPMAARNALESIQVHPTVQSVTFTTDELIQRCPVTGQPDHYDATVITSHQGVSIETKSLKLYLQWLGEQAPMFAEDLAGRIATDVREALGGGWVTVELRQHRRGGIVTEVTAVADGATKGEPR